MRHPLAFRVLTLMLLGLGGAAVDAGAALAVDAATGDGTFGGCRRAAPAMSPLDAYAEAAATTILAEQNCPGIHLEAGRLTTLRLAARVGPAQEGPLEEKLRGRASELRQQLAADGRETWCAAALDAFGPQGRVAPGVLQR